MKIFKSPRSSLIHDTVLCLHTYGNEIPSQHTFLNVSDTVLYMNGKMYFTLRNLQGSNEW